MVCHCPQPLWETLGAFTMLAGTNPIACSDYSLRRLAKVLRLSMNTSPGLASANGGRKGKRLEMDDG